MVIMFTRRGRREELTLAHLLIHSFLTSGAGEQCSRTTLGRPVVATRWRKTWRIISHLSSRLNRFLFSIFQKNKRIYYILLLFFFLFLIVSSIKRTFIQNDWVVDDYHHALYSTRITSGILSISKWIQK